MTNRLPAGASFLLLIVSAMACADTTQPFGSGQNQFTIDFTTIGDPGNRADATGNPSPAGSVGYIFEIGTYEVSREMVTKANAEGNLGITLDPMIAVNGGPRAKMPATGVNWNEAARFVNWLNVAQGYHPAYKFASQPGEAHYNASANAQLWQVGDSGYNASNPLRNQLAHYFLPSTDEWYKAAYFDPNTGEYWNYPNGSDSAPIPVASGTTINTAVYQWGGSQGPADVDLAGGLSPYGVMGLGGNVYEWEESEDDLVNDDAQAMRGVRGGSWGFSEFTASNRSGANPLNPFDDVGFRVASVPEPNTSLLLGLGMCALTWRRKHPKVLAASTLGSFGGRGQKFTGAL